MRSAALAQTFRESPRAAERTCRLLGSSRLLGDALRRQPDFVEALGDDDALSRVKSRDELVEEALGNLMWRPSADERRVGLRRFKRREMLRIAARDLLGFASIETTESELAGLADACVEAALRSVGPSLPFAVIGMGHLGGAELSYASDLDVLFVYDGEDAADFRVADKVAEQLMSELGGITPEGQTFRVDANLRPEGKKGALARSLSGYKAYYERWAQTWEFQALLKARPVGGATDLGAAFLTAAQKRLWERPFTADDVRSVRAMKARAEDALARKGLRDREVKRGRGGIRDIEFAVQLLQLVHGRSDPDLRSPNTLDALAELERAGCVAADDAHALAGAYRFLRYKQKNEAPALDVAARTRLARVMGYRDTVAGDALEQLEEVLRLHQSTVRSIHERLFFRPLLDTLAGSASATLPPGEAETRLAAFGFTDPARTRQAVQELTRGLSRSSRLMRQLMPLLLEWLSESPDPDLGLLGLRKLSLGPQRTTELATAFRDSPEAARRLCVVLGTSVLLTRTLEHHPDLISALGDPDAMAPRPPAALVGLTPPVTPTSTGAAAGASAVQACAGSRNARSCASRHATCSASRATTRRPCPPPLASSPRWQKQACAPRSTRSGRASRSR